MCSLRSRELVPHFQNGGAALVCKYHTWLVVIEKRSLNPPTPYDIATGRGLEMNLGYNPPLKI